MGLTGAFITASSGNIPALPLNTFVPLPASASNTLEPLVPSWGDRWELDVNLNFESTILTVQE